MVEHSRTTYSSHRALGYIQIDLSIRAPVDSRFLVRAIHVSTVLCLYRNQGRVPTTHAKLFSYKLVRG